MKTITSADGTRIAYWREGPGPGLLLVHGGICDRFAWNFVVPLRRGKILWATKEEESFTQRHSSHSADSCNRIRGALPSCGFR
jgi:hypothetical protein